MYGRNVRCPRGSAVEHELRGTNAGRGFHLVSKGLLLAGCAAASLALTAQAVAQSTTLPQVTVEGKKSAAKKGTAKGAPKAAPQQPAEPVQQVETQTAKEKAQKEAVYNTPAAVSTATKSELDTFGQIDTGDVLRSLPGTYTRENMNNPGIAVNIRGFEGSGRVNMMIDGVRQNFRFVGHEARGFMYVDPNLLAGVDIARGAVVTTGGAGSLVGTANFRTLDVDDIIKPGQNAGVLTQATWGTNGLGWSEMVSAGVRNEAVGMAVALSKHDQGNYKNGDGLTVPYTDQDLGSGLFKAYVKPSSDSKISLGGVLYDNHFTANSYYQNVLANTYTLGYTLKPVGNDLVDLKINAYRNEVDMSYIRGIAGIFSPSAGRRINDLGHGFDVSNTSRFRMGSVGVVSQYGAEHFEDKVTTASGGANADGDSTISGLFSQTTFSYGIFDFVTGLRYDHYTLKGAGTVPAGTPAGGPVAPGSSFVVDQDEGRLNPKLTLAVQALKWMQLYGTYSESMRAPTTLETIAGGSHPGSSSVASSFHPNPFLREEVQKGFEFGTNVRINNALARGDSFRLKAAYFMMDVDDYIVMCQPVSGVNYFCNAPGKSKVDGVEVEGMYDAGYWFTGLSYTYNHSKLPDGFASFGGHTYVPEHMATLTIGMRAMDGKLTLGLRGTAASEGYAGTSQAPTEGYALLDFFSSYKLTSNVELGLKVDNVFDLAYSPYTTTPLTTNDPLNPLTMEQGRGRTVLLTARSQF